MNKLQWITLAVAALNLALIALFPPFDYLPPIASGVGAFQGFGFALHEQPSRTINASFLQIEIFVVVVNAAIAWLLLRERPSGAAGKKTDWQKVVLVGVALNLLLVLLFPPMQYTRAVTRAALPSFESFYFVFGGYDNMAIVVELLYLEVIFVLVNGGLLYLLFRNSAQVELTPEMRSKLAAELRRKS